MRIIAFLAVSQLIMACQLLSPNDGEHSHTLNTNLSLINYYLWINKLNNEELNVEYKLLSKQTKQLPYVFPKLMLFHSLPDSPFYNPKQALSDYEHSTNNLLEQEQLLLDLLCRQIKLQILFDQKLALESEKKIKMRNLLKQQNATIDSLKEQNILLQHQISQLKLIENSINNNGQ